jgi:N-acetylmuramoyl-L-alanine amidase
MMLTLQPIYNYRRAIQTIFVLVVWLFLQNFNLGPRTDQMCGAQSDISTLKKNGHNGGYQLKKVVLDAGHGGKDPGCIGVNKTYEKHHTLAMVLALGRRIKEAYPDVEVIYTRDTDVFVELKERAAIANRNNADLFISIHCNALSVPTANGAETYVMGLHTAKENLEVAKRENASIYLEDDYQKNYEGYDPDSPEAHIAGSLWQSAYLEQSILLASMVQHQANTIATRNDRGVKQAGFLVLRATAMPSVLIEAGYLTNADEERYLASDAGRDQMAEAIFNAFKSYKTQMETGVTEPETTPKSVTPKPAPQPKKAQNKPETPKKAPPTTQKPATVPATAPAKPNATSWPGASVPTPAAGTKTTTTKITYRVMVAASKTRLDPNKGRLAVLNNVIEEKATTAQGAEYQYFIGNFATRSEADRTLSEMKNLGFATAQIVEKKQ